MRSYVALGFVVVLLAGCGGEPEAPPKTSAKDVLSRAADALRSVGEGAEAEGGELTDDVMEQYVKLSKELTEAARAGTSPLAIMKQHGWNMERWVRVSTEVSQALESAGRGAAREAFAQQETQIKERLQELQGQLSSVAPEVKSALEDQIDALESTLRDLEAEARDLAPSGEMDAKSWEVLQRWLPKLQAIDDAR